MQKRNPRDNYLWDSSLKCLDSICLEFVLSFTPVITRVKVYAILTVIRSFELTNGTR